MWYTRACLYTRIRILWTVTITRIVFILSDVKSDKSINTAGYLLWAKQNVSFLRDSLPNRWNHGLNNFLYYVFVHLKDYVYSTAITEEKSHIYYKHLHSSLNIICWPWVFQPLINVMTQTMCLCAREGNNHRANKRLVKLPTVPKGISFSKPRMHLLKVWVHKCV